MIINPNFVGFVYFNCSIID